MSRAVHRVWVRATCLIMPSSGRHTAPSSLPARPAPPPQSARSLVHPQRTSHRHVKSPQCEWRAYITPYSHSTPTPQVALPPAAAAQSQPEPVAASRSQLQPIVARRSQPQPIAASPSQPARRSHSRSQLQQLQPASRSQPRPAAEPGRSVYSRPPSWAQSILGSIQRRSAAREPLHASPAKLFSILR